MPVRVSTLTVFPASMNNGTAISAPLESFACFMTFVAVFPLIPGSVSITFGPGTPVPPDRVMALIKRSGGQVRLRSEYALHVRLPDERLATATAAVKKCLQALR